MKRKKNTHYLTDAIIRSCLNIEGSNNREKGLYFAINSKNPFIEFNFQRLDEQTIEKAIGRKPTDEEIENAKQIPFSVDYIFCNDCENKFTDIETEFIEKILPKFRKNDLTGLDSLSIQENLICRNFFYLQIFRSAVCEKVFNLPILENLYTGSSSDSNNLHERIYHLVPYAPEIQKYFVKQNGKEYHLISLFDKARRSAREDELMYDNEFF